MRFFRFMSRGPQGPFGDAFGGVTGAGSDFGQEPYEEPELEEEEPEYEDVLGEDEPDDDEGRGDSQGRRGSDNATGAPVPSDALTSLLHQDAAFRQQELAAQREAREEARRQQEEAKKAEREERRKRELDETVSRLIPDTKDLDLTPEERQTYERSASVIDKLARRRMAEYAQQHLAPTVRQLAEQNQRLSQDMEALRNESQRNAVDNIDNRLRMVVPDIDRIVTSREFAAFRGQEVPGVPGMRYGDLIADYYNRNDAGSVARLLQYYQEQQRKEPASRKEPVTRSGTAASAPSTRKKPRLLKWSQLQEAERKFERGQIDAAKLEDIQNKFEIAASENRVDYDH